MSGFPPPGWRKCDCGRLHCETRLRDTKKATLAIIPIERDYAVLSQSDSRFTDHNLSLDEALRIAEQWAKDDGGWA